MLICRRRSSLLVICFIALCALCACQTTLTHIATPRALAPNEVGVSLHETTPVYSTLFSKSISGGIALYESAQDGDVVNLIESQAPDLQDSAPRLP